MYLEIRAKGWAGLVTEEGVKQKWGGGEGGRKSSTRGELLFSSVFIRVKLRTNRE